MPPITDNPTDRTREEGDDAGWARWEQMFRDARPVLPEAAMARIEASIQREAERVATQPPSRLRRRIIFLLLIIVLINLAIVWVLMHDWDHGRHSTGNTFVPGSVEDRYSVDAAIGLPLAAPDSPIVPLDDYPQWTFGEPTSAPTPVATTQPARAMEMLRAAARLPCNGHHALALLDMRRAMHVSAPLPAPFSPDVDEFRIGACWQMLPLSPQTVTEFRKQLNLLKIEPVPTSWDHRFWIAKFDVLRADYDAVTPNAVYSQGGLPAEFPSRAAQRARFDVLTEMGDVKAQAALDVLSTRSYSPLSAIKPVFENQLRYDTDWVSCSHDLIERLFALRHSHRNGEADELVAATRKLKYLTNPQDLAILVARLGPTGAWEKLLEPLMRDEVAFIQHPPSFDDIGLRSSEMAVVRAGIKSTSEGVTTYTGAPISLVVGPWRITCDRMSVFRSTNDSHLLSGAGQIRVHGIIGFYAVSANEATFNTETGDLKLSGHVHLDGWTKITDAKSCTIIRTGEVREVVVDGTK